MYKILSDRIPFCKQIQNLQSAACSLLTHSPCPSVQIVSFLFIWFFEPRKGTPSAHSHRREQAALIGQYAWHNVAAQSQRSSHIHQAVWSRLQLPCSAGGSLGSCRDGMHPGYGRFLIACRPSKCQAVLILAFFFKKKWYRENSISTADLRQSH